MIMTASLSQSQERIDSLSKLNQSHLLLENINVVEAVANSDSSSTVHVCQSRSHDMSHEDQTPVAGEGREFSPTKELDAGETERQLGERLIALKREVCEYEFAVATRG